MLNEHSKNLAIKIAGGTFVTIVAPLIVAICMKYAETAFTPDPPPAPPATTVLSGAAFSTTAAPLKTAETVEGAAPIKTADPAKLTDAAPVAALRAPTPTSAQTGGAPQTEGSAIPAVDRDNPSPVSAADRPNAERVIRLFNGRDLAGFYTYEGVPKTADGSIKKGATHYGKNHDPEKVFTTVAGVLRISGKVWGVLVTEKEYENYHLTAEFKWGEKTWPPQEENARTSGIFLHCLGPDGAFKGWGLNSIKCQINEGTTGDFFLTGESTSHKVSIAVETRTREFKKDGAARIVHFYQPGEPLTTFSTGFVRRRPSNRHVSDVKGFRGDQEIEAPVGEWNTIECICRGDRITLRLNGQTVNEASSCNPSRGKIAFQSALAEVFFRSITLKALPGFSSALPPTEEDSR